MDTAQPGVGHGLAKLRMPLDEDFPITAEDPAVRVLSDFTQQQPVTVLEHVPIDDALALMKSAGVRALIVLRDEAIAGLVTSYDIQGERAVRFQQSASHISHKEVEVGDVMTPWEQVPVLEWRWVTRAHVKEIAAIFRKFMGTHLVVIEHAEAGTTFVRGLISRTRLAPLLG